jgi:hypothetical protein
MKYHGISAYQFYMALKHVSEETAPDFTYGNSNWEHLSVKTDIYSLAGTNLLRIGGRSPNRL